MTPTRKPAAPFSTVPRAPSGAASDALPTWRVNVMRVGYLVMGAGLAATQWPELLSGGPWELRQGTVVAMLVAMSLLALLGLRYPQRMLPILLFEVTWKLIWLASVALPHWLDGTLTGATREQTDAVLWVVIIIAVVPWTNVVRQFATARGERWRRPPYEPTLRPRRQHATPRPDLKPRSRLRRYLANGALLRTADSTSKMA